MESFTESGISNSEGRVASLVDSPSDPTQSGRAKALSRALSLRSAFVAVFFFEGGTTERFFCLAVKGLTAAAPITGGALLSRRLKLKTVSFSHHKRMPTANVSIKHSVEHDTAAKALGRIKNKIITQEVNKKLHNSISI